MKGKKKKNVHQCYYVTFQKKYGAVTRCNKSKTLISDPMFYITHPPKSILNDLHH